jgi:histone-lysine N-methyltransferase SETMAR
MKFEVLPHLPYSPDLAPSHFHLFGPLKESLRGRKFNLDDDVQSAVHEWLKGQPQDFFSSGIQALVSRWCKCIELQGDYVDL